MPDPQTRPEPAPKTPPAPAVPTRPVEPPEYDVPETPPRDRPKVMLHFPNVPVPEKGKDEKTPPVPYMAMLRDWRDDPTDPKRKVLHDLLRRTGPVVLDGHFFWAGNLDVQGQRYQSDGWIAHPQGSHTIGQRAVPPPPTKIVAGGSRRPASE